MTEPLAPYSLYTEAADGSQTGYGYESLGEAADALLTLLGGEVVATELHETLPTGGTKPLMRCEDATRVCVNIEPPDEDIDD